MKYTLSGHSNRNAAEEMLITLLPGEKHEYIENACQNERNVLFSSLSETEKTVLGRAFVTTENGKFEGACKINITGLDEDAVKRSKNRAVKLSVYRAVIKIIGKKPAWGALSGVRPSKLAVKCMSEGMSGRETEKLLKSRYDVSSDKRKLLIKTATAALNAKKDMRPLDTSLYISIPFCPSRCAYCSFVSHSVKNSRKLIPLYLETLYSEMREVNEIIKQSGFNISTVYIGGGTPTVLTEEQLSELIFSSREIFDFSNVIEYTVEAGRPDTIDEGKLKVMRDLGVTRISINPQSMVDDVLKRSLRPHSAEDIRAVYKTARGIGGFDINMDLIAGLPGDTEEGFSKSLDEIIKMCPENITVHTLALKKGADLKHDAKYESPMGKSVQGMLKYAERALFKSGYAPYYIYRQKYSVGGFENVGYAKAGKECLYNLYMMEEMQTIFSVGAGAVTKMRRADGSLIDRIINPKYPYEYTNEIDRINRGKKKILEFFDSDAK